MSTKNYLALCFVALLFVVCSIQASAQQGRRMRGTNRQGTVIVTRPNGTVIVKTGMRHGRHRHGLGRRGRGPFVRF